MAQQNITPGSAPILWSSVSDAFDKINANFTELYLTISGGSSGAVDLENLASNVSPNTSGAFFLGSSDNRWKALYLTTDGIDIGGAVVFSPDGAAVNLPAGSTVGGELIKNPAEASFKNIEVSGQTTVSADNYTDTVTFAGTDINITTNATTDTVTFVNNGVTQLNGTANEIGVSGTGKGNVTLTNLGVTQLVGTAGQIGISGTLTGGRGQVTLTNLGVTSITAGTGISISPVGGTGAVTITNDLPDTFGFRTIAVTGQSSVVAEVREDTLTLTAGTNIFITTVPGTDTITISSTTSFDLKGSVFGDDSTLLVDAVNGIIPAAVVSGTFTGILKGSVFADDSTQIIDGNTATVYGNIEATTLRTAETQIALGGGAGVTNQGLQTVAVGESAGSVDQGNRTVSIGSQAGQYRQSAYGVAIGPSSGFYEQGDSAVAIGDNAGQSSQGDYAIAVGHYAGHNNQSANSIILNASGVAVNGVAAQTNSFYVAPIRTTANGTPLMYNSTTKEITYSNVLEFIGSTISTSDSSGITVDVQTTFNSDVTIDNELTVTGNLIVNGTTTTINSVTLTVDDKNIELGSIASPTDVTADGGGITLKGTTDKTFTYVNSTGLWTANIGVAATSFTGLAAAATTASTAASVGYMGIPQSATTTTLVIGDAGKHIYVNTSGQTLTIPAATSVAYPIGTTITFIAGPSASTVTIAITTDTMYLTGTGTTGSRTLAAHGMATAVKVSGTSSSGVWYINGSGLT